MGLSWNTKKTGVEWMVEIPEGTSGSCKLAGDKGSIAPAMMQSFYWTLRERKSSKPSFSDELKMGLSNKGRVKTSQVNTVCTGIIFLLWAEKAGSTCISGGPPRCPVGWSPCRSRHWGKSLAVCPAVFLTPGCWWIFRGEGNIKKMRKNTHLGVQVISLRGFLQIGQVAFTLK